MPEWSNGMGDIGKSKMLVIFENIQQRKAQENSEKPIVLAL